MISHEEFKEKKFEYEISQISEETNFQHMLIPNDLRVNKFNIY